jgi:hypothetical protein
MIKRYLNLIPNSQKIILKRERMFYLIHGIVGLIVVVIAVNAILLSAARFILIEHFKTLKEDTYLVNVEHTIIQNNIGKINNRINYAATMQMNFIKWSALLSELTNDFPEGVTIDFLNVNTQSSTFKLTGTATNREELIATKEMLEKSEIISKLESPLSNFLEKEDIDFRFSGTLEKNIYNRAPAQTVNTEPSL